MAHTTSFKKLALSAAMATLVFTASAQAADFAPVKTLTVGTDPSSLASGDLNGDNIPDLVVTNFNDGNVSVLLGSADNLGNFNPATPATVAVGSDPVVANRLPFGVEIGNLVGDANPDIVVAVSGSDEVTILPGIGDGTFGTAIHVPAGIDPRDVILADVDGTLGLDIIAANFSGSTATVLLNNGDDTFTPAAGSPFAAGTQPFDLVFADATGDGTSDIVLVNLNSDTVSVLDGTDFTVRTTFTTGALPFGVVVADLDGDLDPDLVTANANGDSVSVLLGDGLGGFATKVDTPLAVNSGPHGIAIANVGGTSDLDLVVTNTDDSTINVLEGNGSGSFAVVTNTFSVGNMPRPLVLDDFDGDSNLDIATTDTNGGSTSARVLINDNQPVATDDPFNIISDSINIALDVLANDSDPDTGDTLTITAFDNPGNQGGAVSSSGASLDYTPPGGFSGTETFTYTIEDQFGYPATATVTAIVGANQNPTDIGLSANSVDENATNNTVVGTLSTVDPDTGDSFTYSLTDSAGGRFKLAGAGSDEIQVADGTLLDFETNTSHNITVQTTDSGGLAFSRSLIINVNDVNEAPTDIALSSAVVDENIANNSVVGTLTTTDPDTGDTHSYSLVDTAGGRFKVAGSDIQVADSSLLDFEAGTTHNVTVRTTDSGTGPLTFDKVFAITVNNVNEAPVPTAPAISTNEDTDGTSQIAPNDPDAGDSHTYAVTGPGTNGTAVVSTSGLVTYTPSLNFSGTDSVTVTVTDSGSLSAPVPIGVTVIVQNDPPIAVSSISPQSGTEGTAFGALNVFSNFSDPDSTLTYSLSGLPAGTGLVIDASTAVISGTPMDADAKASQPITVTVSATDGSTPASQQFALTISDINNGPAFTSTEVTSATQDVAYTYNITTSDADAGDTLSLISGTLPGWLTLTDNGDGTATLSGTPTNADVTSGSVDVVLTVTDSGAGNLTNTQSFTINLTDVNDTPAVTSGGIILFQDTTGTVQVSVSDPDTGDTFTYAVSQQPVTAGGTASVDTSGLVTYDGTGASVGTDSIEVTVTDSGTPAQSTPVTIPLTVNASGETDSNNDGLTDAQAIALGLDPNEVDGDTDGDTAKDANEVGDPSNPTDTDSDNVIDALEAGSTASDASTANGLLLESGDQVEIVSSGQALSNVAAGSATGGPAGVTFPFGTVIYTTTSAVGGSVTVRMSFSADLPASLALYKVDNGGTYTELSTSIWTKVDARTVDVTLTDGDPATDLDGIANGSIEDPVAIASVPALTSGGGGGGGGGCTLGSAGNTVKDPLMPFMLLGALAMLYSRRRAKV